MKKLLNGWLPMDEAPRTGRRITLYVAGRGVFEGWWHSSISGDEAYWMDDHDSEPDPIAWKPLEAGPFEQRGLGAPVAWRRRRKGSSDSSGWTMCPDYPGRDPEFDLQSLFLQPVTRASAKSEASATQKLSLIQIGILKDISANKIALDEETSDFLRDQIVELAMIEQPQLIDVSAPLSSSRLPAMRCWSPGTNKQTDLAETGKISKIVAASKRVCAQRSARRSTVQPAEKQLKGAFGRTISKLS
ncbi:MAG: hypothetical protein WDN48_06290 [Pseudolabrys sp.]